MLTAGFGLGEKLANGRYAMAGSAEQRLRLIARF
jgi:hypothetical protein